MTVEGNDGDDVTFKSITVSTHAYTSYSAPQINKVSPLITKYKTDGTDKLIVIGNHLGGASVWNLPLENGIEEPLHEHHSGQVVIEQSGGDVTQNVYSVSESGGKEYTTAEDESKKYRPHHRDNSRRCTASYVMSRMAGPGRVKSMGSTKSFPES